MPLHETLLSSSQQQRFEVATRLIEDMRAPGETANRNYWQICQQVIAAKQAQEGPTDAALPGWEFTADNSALLVLRHPRRVRGFLNAIADVPQAGSIIDAGCGSSALLAVAAAVTHPRAEVFAYEVNGPAARCARQVVELMGVSDRVSVIESDVLTSELPEVDLGITETFAIGLLTEQGHKITERLAHSAAEILPNSARIYACDEVPTADTFWQSATSINFRKENNVVEGTLRSKGLGKRPIHAYAAFFDARQDPIVTEVGTNLTKPVYLGNIVVKRPDSTITFRYELGSELHEKPAELHITS